MKAETKALPRKKGKGQESAQRVTVHGRPMVVLEAAEYDRLLQKADEWEPLLPLPGVDGNYPGIEYARASLARKIVRHRRRVGLTQAELARRAGIRAETLNRIEHGKHCPTVRTVDKIDRALRETDGDSGH